MTILPFVRRAPATRFVPLRPIVIPAAVLEQRRRERAAARLLPIIGGVPAPRRAIRLVSSSARSILE